jgi:hypothetical protein
MHLLCSVLFHVVTFSRGKYTKLVLCHLRQVDVAEALRICYIGLRRHHGNWAGANLHRKTQIRNTP